MSVIQQFNLSWEAPIATTRPGGDVKTRTIITYILPTTIIPVPLSGYQNLIYCLIFHPWTESNSLISRNCYCTLSMTGGCAHWDYQDHHISDGANFSLNSDSYGRHKYCSVDWDDPLSRRSHDDHFHLSMEFSIQGGDFYEDCTTWSLSFQAY